MVLFFLSVSVRDRWRSIRSAYSPTHSTVLLLTTTMIFAGGGSRQSRSQHLQRSPPRPFYSPRHNAPEGCSAAAEKHLFHNDFWFLWLKKMSWHYEVQLKHILFTIVRIFAWKSKPFDWKLHSVFLYIYIPINIPPPQRMICEFMSSKQVYHDKWT